MPEFPQNLKISQRKLLCSGAKRKNSLLAGFFVIAAILAGFFWFRNNFLISRDSFSGFTPVDTAIYWHISASNPQGKEWFFTKTKEILNREESFKIDFLFNDVVPGASELSLAIFSSLQDFVCYAELNYSKIEELKEKIGNNGLFLLDLEGGRWAITNNKVILNEISNIQNGEMPSLFTDPVLKMAMNKAGKKNLGQIYLKNNLKIGNLPLFFGKSNMVEENYLYVYPAKVGKGEKKDFDYEYSLVSDGFFLTANTIETIKSALAFIFPEVVARRLPDGTSVKEIIANSNIFNFEEEKSSQDIMFMKIKAAERELWLKDEGERVFLSTNKGDLINFSEEEERLIEDYGKNMFDFYLWIAKKMNFTFGGAVFGVNIMQ